MTPYRHHLVTCAGIALASIALAQAPSPTDPASARPAAPVAPIAPAQPDEASAQAELIKVQTNWKSRLEALRPSDPEGYFTLAEEVADAAPGDLASRQIAARLYIIAMNLDLVRNPTRPALAASACIALADLDPNAAESTWLLALAQRLDPRQSRPQWLTPPASAAPDSVQFRIATAIGMIRTGDGIQAKRILSDRAVEPSFRALDRLLRRTSTLSVRDLLREASRWPCPECANQRVVRRPGVAPPEYRVCATCGGTPGPDLSTPQLIEHLRIESYLLDVGQRSWGAQTLVDGGVPIVDPEPDSVAKAFAVNPRQTLFRNGEWVAPAGDAPPSPRAPTPSPQATPQSGPASSDDAENPTNAAPVPVQP